MKLGWLPPFQHFPETCVQKPPSGFRPTWAEIDLQAFDHNLSIFRHKISAETAIMAVVKDNAYGHGAVPVARYLERRVAMFGVAVLEEALLLREAGIVSPILILNGLWPGQESTALRNDLTPVVFTLDALREWERAASEWNRPAGFHLKVDTGMNRLGLLPEDLPGFLDAAIRTRFVCLEGVMTHLASADDPDSTTTDRQLAVFRECVASVRNSGLTPRWIHAANSAAILGHRSAHFNLVRPGIALYGYHSRNHEETVGLRSALQLKSRISLLKEIPPGSPVGYGGTFVARRYTRLATIPIGYGDGFSRSWSNRGVVHVCGCQAPVVGRVSMDSITIDVTEIPEARAGSETTILGSRDRGEIDAARMASQLGTIPYEVLTSLSPRIGRIYLNSKEALTEEGRN